MAVAALAAAGCSRHLNDFSQFATLPEQGWAYNDTLSFNADIDSVATGTLQIAVRHTNDYPYRNLYVEVTIPEADGSLLRDTVDLRLSDVYGNWLGSGLGTSFQCAGTIDRKVTLRRGAHITVRHVMRPDPVTDIEQVGLLFEGDDSE